MLQFGAEDRATVDTKNQNFKHTNVIIQSRKFRSDFVQNYMHIRTAQYLQIHLETSHV